MVDIKTTVRPVTLSVYSLLYCIVLVDSTAWFTGSGTGDASDWITFLNTARNQFSPNPFLQDISWLYTPTWNGFVEGD